MKKERYFYGESIAEDPASGTQGREMKEVQWYFPETIEEALSLIGRDDVIPHAGGTGILRGSLKRVRGLVDLSRLPLRHHYHRGNILELGACCTFSDTVAYIERIDGDFVLVKALSKAASTPLRNRITLGGSIAVVPTWSDLVGPLIALDAEVEVAGTAEGRFPVSRYVDEPALRRGTLLTGVRIRMDSWRSSHYREMRTHADHPAFTVTLLLRGSGENIDEFRAVVTGCTGRYRRLTELEESLKGAAAGSIRPEDVGSLVRVSFTGKKFQSPDYLTHLVRVQVERGVHELLGG
jgi:CO/xanthine dehydrogenase FAD-binding subunit